MATPLTRFRGSPVADMIPYNRGNGRAKLSQSMEHGARQRLQL